VCSIITRQSGREYCTIGWGGDEVPLIASTVSSHSLSHVLYMDLPLAVVHTPDSQMRKSPESAWILNFNLLQYPKFISSVRAPTTNHQHAPRDKFTWYRSSGITRRQAQTYKAQSSMAIATATTTTTTTTPSVSVPHVANSGFQRWAQGFTLQEVQALARQPGPHWRGVTPPVPPRPFCPLGFQSISSVRILILLPWPGLNVANRLGLRYVVSRTRSQ
jgi:hypothetical protein